MANADTSIDRQSLNTDLLSRYNSSKVGGAYNAKLAGTSTESSAQAALYDNTGNFVIKQPQGISNFKNVGEANYKEVSKYAQKVGESTSFSQQADRYDNTGNFVIRQQKGISNFKGVKNGNYKEVSAYASNLSTVKYKP
jgi:hypothetical protein